MAQLLKEYYQARAWDKAGVPPPLTFSFKSIMQKIE